MHLVLLLFLSLQYCISAFLFYLYVVKQFVIEKQNYGIAF